MHNSGKLMLRSAGTLPASFRLFTVTYQGEYGVQVIGHDAPGTQVITVAVEMPQGVDNNGRHFAHSQRAIPFSRVQIVIDSTDK